MLGAITDVAVKTVTGTVTTAAASTVSDTLQAFVANQPANIVVRTWYWLTSSNKSLIDPHAVQVFLALYEELSPFCASSPHLPEAIVACWKVFELHEVSHKGGICTFEKEIDLEKVKKRY